MRRRRLDTPVICNDVLSVHSTDSSSEEKDPYSPVASILIVEDDSDAAFLIRRLLDRAGITAPVEVVTDGEQAIDYLKKCQGTAGCPLPDLLLLDLNLPRCNGFSVLAWIRAQPDLERLRIIVMSSSNWPADVQRARELGADDYLEKYPSDADFVARIRQTSYLLLAREIKTLGARR
jgi:CheY-like chemotaxis protein